MFAGDTDLKERHLFVTAARLGSQGYPRVRRSLLRSTANRVCHQLPSPVINNQIIASLKLQLSRQMAISPASKPSVVSLSQKNKKEDVGKK